ncbi:2-C-methyl-D-erythritol 2,4-cyclodiphosphate synthase [Thermocrinis jamiesonii]|uniref:2-C-methyl-D-erythritol 2,4-cyclodiphosphate synthase n=1 Tax=Thermocrinis jamiesonii TaxID=1302351 RepID=UPI000495F0A8|nr:2-C-methyl-D-erythritol 2,4-cyclodiphosphate synthase [Thermocrinis jamiesonii]
MFRIGFGFDSHDFEEGKPLVLGGVLIDFPKGLKGHSDGDVLLHALTDALLSAVGEEDIGQLFSDKDPRWKLAQSSLFLKSALEKVSKKGYMIVNVDCTLIADEPKIAPIKNKIIQNLSLLLGIEQERISVKGKTREGFCQSEGIACFCVVLLQEKKA